MARRRNDERNARIAELRVQGVSVAELAEQFDLSQSVIYSVIASQGVFGERGARRVIRFCARCEGPIYRGANARYCSSECFHATQEDNRPICAHEGCEVRVRRSSSKYCSIACYNAAQRAFWEAGRDFCQNPGCNSRLGRRVSKYCCMACANEHREALSFKGRPCAHPDCTRFTTTLNQKYCSPACRQKILKVPGGATDQREERERRRYGRQCLDCGCSLDHLALHRQRCHGCAHKRLREKQRSYDRNRKGRRKRK